jgi:cytochrome c553
VTPPGFVGPRAVDETTWQQAALLNNDSSHGPIKCASCHETNANGTVKGTHLITYQGTPIDTDLQTAIAWAHTFTAGHSLADTTCVRCHASKLSELSCGALLDHLDAGRIERRHAIAIAQERGLSCTF